MFSPSSQRSSPARMNHLRSLFNKPDRRLGWVILLGLSIRWCLLLIAAQQPQRFYYDDSYTYAAGAQTLLELGSYARSLDFPQTPQTLYPPGYSLLIAGVYRLAGENSAAVVFLQTLLTMAAAWLVYQVGARLCSQKVGLLAALLLALDMNLIGSDLRMLTETLFTFLLTLFCAAAVFTLSQPEERWASPGAILLSGGALGFSLAAATLTRPISYYLLFPVLVCLLAWCVQQRWTWTQRGLMLLSFAVPVALLVGGWQLRNLSLTGDSALSQIEAVNLLWYRAADVIAIRDQIDIEAARKMLMGPTDVHYIELIYANPGLSRQWKATALDVLLHHPKEVLVSQAKGLLKMFIFPGQDGLLVLLGVPIQATSPIGDALRLSPAAYVERWLVGQPVYLLASLAGLAWLGLLYSGAAVFLIDSVFHLRSLKLSVWCLAAVMVYFVVISAGPEANARFRIPITPILALASAAGLVTLKNRLKSR